MRWGQLLWGTRPQRTLIRAAVLAVLCIAFVRYVSLPMHVAGRSMEPTVHDGSWLLANLLKYRWREPQRGEIVVIRLFGRRVFYLKRVLGRPGERIALDAGRLLINGQVTAEPYLSAPGNWTMPELRLASDEYFVAGDNRSMPLPQHQAGIVRRADIVGGLLK